MQKVTMTLTDKDMDSLNYIHARLNTRNEAGAVSTSLGIAHIVMQAKQRGSRIIIENKNGSKQTLIVPVYDLSNCILIKTNTNEALK